MSPSWSTFIQIHSLFISVNRSTRFGWNLHPSSGPHVTVSTPSGISKTVTATCRERDVSAVGGWRYQPKHVERFTDINKLYVFASFWTIIGKNLYSSPNISTIKSRRTRQVRHVAFRMEEICTEGLSEGNWKFRDNMEDLEWRIIIEWFLKKGRD